MAVQHESVRSTEGRVAMLARRPRGGSPEEPQLLVLGVVVRDDLGRGHADLHAVHHELPGLLQSLPLPLGFLTGSTWTAEVRAFSRSS